MKLAFPTGLPTAVQGLIEYACEPSLRICFTRLIASTSLPVRWALICKIVDRPSFSVAGTIRTRSVCCLLERALTRSATLLVLAGPDDWERSDDTSVKGAGAISCDITLWAGGLERSICSDHCRHTSRRLGATRLFGARVSTRYSNKCHQAQRLTLSWSESNGGGARASDQRVAAIARASPIGCRKVASAVHNGLSRHAAGHPLPTEQPSLT